MRRSPMRQQRLVAAVPVWPARPQNPAPRTCSPDLPGYNHWYKHHAIKNTNANTKSCSVHLLSRSNCPQSPIKTPRNQKHKFKYNYTKSCSAHLLLRSSCPISIQTPCNQNTDMIGHEQSWYSIETVQTFPIKGGCGIPPHHKNGMTGCGFNSLLRLPLVMNSDPRAQIQDPRANRKWSGGELGSQIRALERPELLNYEVDSGGFWGQDPPAAQLTKELLHYTGACGKYLYTYVHKPSVWFGTFVSFTRPCQSLSHKTRVELNTWFSNYFQLELEIRLPSLERERSLVLFCLPAKALLASGGCLRTKGGLSLRNNSFLVATTWRDLPPTK